MKAADYRPLIVSYRNGAPVRLSDVAHVTDSVQTVRSLGPGEREARRPDHHLPPARGEHHFDRGRDQGGASRSCTRPSIPAIDLTIALDQTTTIRASVKNVEATLLISIVLVVLVVFVFLREWRATLDPDRGGAGLDHRDARVHVPASATASTTSRSWR
jgi:multidrug efflux pump